MKNHRNPSLVMVQEQIEREGIEAGRQAYFSAMHGKVNPWHPEKVSKRTTDQTLPGKILIDRALKPVAQSIEDWYQFLMSGKAGRGSDVAQWLTPLWEKLGDKAASFVAFVSLKTVLANLGEARRKSSMGIAQAIQDEIELIAFSEGFGQDGRPLAGLLEYMMNRLNEQTNNRNHKRTVIMGLAGLAGLEGIGWTTGKRLKIGDELLERVVGFTGWFKAIERVKLGAKGATEVYIEATPELSRVLTEAHELTALTTPVFPPMIVEPEDWTSPYTGAYLTKDLSRKVQFVKTPNEELLAEMERMPEQLAPVYDAVNKLQKVAYRINRGVLDVVWQAWTEGLTIGDLPARKLQELPYLSDNAKSMLDYKKGWIKQEKKAGRITGTMKKKAVNDLFYQTHPQFQPLREEVLQYAINAKPVHEFNNHPRRVGDLIEVQRVLTVAKEFASYDNIYFPHQLDFRGRAYPVSHYLNPQGSDLCKGLLEFGEGKAIDQGASYWLAVHGANCWALDSKDDPWMLKLKEENEEASPGLDKVAYQYRYEWVLVHETQIVLSAQDPLNFTWWTQADNPWMFLAFCLEWYRWKQEGEGMVSYLPIGSDGSCNGIQHWVGLLKDEETAPKVNVVPTDKPGDIYKDVAKEVIAIARKDLSAKDDEARAMATFWLPRIKRSLVKRAVMTTPYGVTSYGVRSQIRKLLKDEKKGDNSFKNSSKDFQKTALSWLVSAIEAAMLKSAKSAKVGMAWMQIVAKALAEDGIAINWTTPDGFVVWQGYPETEKKSIKTYLSGEFTVKQRAWETTEEIDEETGEVLEELEEVESLASEVEGKKKQKVAVTVLHTPVPGKLKVSKNANAIAPNVVHSLDATAMRMTVVKAMAAGVSSMMTVHDSFSCHAADFETMQRATREAFMELHSQNYLENWLYQVTAVMEDKRLEELHTTLHEKFGGLVPQSGKLDLSLVLDALYFFA